MTKRKSGRRGLLLGALAAPALLRPAWAQTFPSKPIRLVVPFPPAGAADITARLVGERVAALLDDRKRLERELSDARRKLAMGGGTRSGEDGVRQVGDIKLLARTVSGIEIKDLKSLADDGKKQVGSGVVAIVGVTGEGKAGLVVGVTPDLTQRFNAVELVRRGAEALGGKGGGGRPDMAQAGGPDGGKAEAALEAIAAALDGA